LAELATLHCRDDGTVQASVAVLILGEQAVRGEDISARGRSAELLVALTIIHHGGGIIHVIIVPSAMRRSALLGVRNLGKAARTHGEL
jgi:hypothetical protein